MGLRTLFWRGGTTVPLLLTPVIKNVTAWMNKLYTVKLLCVSVSPCRFHVLLTQWSYICTCHCGCRYAARCRSIHTVLVRTTPPRVYPTVIHRLVATEFLCTIVQHFQVACTGRLVMHVIETTVTNLYIHIHLYVLYLLAITYSNQSFYGQIARYQRGVGDHRVGQWWEGVMG